MDPNSSLPNNHAQIIYFIPFKFALLWFEIEVISLWDLEDLADEISVFVESFGEGENVVHIYDDNPRRIV